MKKLIAAMLSVLAVSASSAYALEYEVGSFTFSSYDNYQGSTTQQQTSGVISACDSTLREACGEIGASVGEISNSIFAIKGGVGDTCHATCIINTGKQVPL